jgi:hypothetical protein
MGRFATFSLNSNSAIMLPSSAADADAGKVLIVKEADKVVLSALKFPTSVETTDAGKTLVVDGTGKLIYKAVLPLPATLPIAGKILQSDGTTIIDSGFTLPTAAVTTDIGKVLTVTDSGVVDFTALSVAVPTISYWNSGTSYAPVLPDSSTLLFGKTGVTTLVVGGDVCDGRYCSAAGLCCLWTVPTGATEAEFQIWGGGGNSAGCNHGTCYALGAPGGNGEYTYVRMNVTAGQTYTLCAGGALTQGSCYSYTNQNGCNSFVCGANSTCIMSCGGQNGLCSDATFYCTYYPSFPATYNNTTMWVCTCDQGNPTGGEGTGQRYRHDGACGVGKVTSANKIAVIAKVPSSIGSTKQCCGGYYYGKHSNRGIKLDHSLSMTGHCGHVSQCYGWGCTWESCRTSYSLEPGRFPGMGGVPSAYFCGSYDSYYGDRGASGLIRVSYK